VSQARWSRPPRWLLAVGGILLAAAATVPFTFVDLQDMSAALALLVAALVALIVGPRWGLLVAAAAWALFFAFPADQELRTLFALPFWLVLGVVAGLLGDRMRSTGRERRLAGSELDAVRATPSQAIVELDLDGKITGWSTGAEELYGYTAEEVAEQEIGLLDGDGSSEVLTALDVVRQGERASLERIAQRRKDGSTALVSLTLAPISDGGGVVGACALIRDDTTEQHAREELERAERKYRALAEGLPLVTWLSAPGDRSSIDYISPQIETLLGYTATQWRNDPKLFGKVLHPEDRERVLARRGKVTANGTGQSQDEYRLISRSGGVVWVREETMTIRSAESEPLYTQTFLLDDGERRRAHDERERLLAAERSAASRTVERQRRLDFLREAGQLLASSVDYKSATQRVAELAVRDYADWCVVDVTEDGSPLRRIALARAELLQHGSGSGPGAEPEPGVLEVVEGGAAKVVPALGESAKGEDRPQLLGGIEARTSICVPLRSQKRTLGALTLARTESREVFGADDVALAEDLAARLALTIDRGHLFREVEERRDAERVLQHVADGVLLIDRGGIVRLWNPAAEAITSIRIGEIVGKAAADAIPGWREAVDSVPVSATPDPGHAEVVIPVETKRGERWISISGVEFFGGTVYAFRDLTEVRHLEELKADFIATASHELRTPLAAVYGAAQTLLRHDFALDEGGRDRFVSLIAEESERLGRIVNEILLANQLDAGRLDLGSEPFDAVEVVERVVEATRAYAPPEISLEVLVADEVPRVFADRDKARQVLVNLIENAIKYSPDGGRVEVGVEPRDTEVRFHVKDEGMGIPPEEQSRVFEKFYRLDPQMTRGVGGTGLGLYICDELVGRMGGRIWVEGNKDKGSTFFFDLPADEAAASTRRLPEPVDIQARGFPPRHRPHPARRP
jgi:PAS domain S-box-containing protein